MQHAANPTKGNNILDLVFIHGFPNVDNFVIDYFPGSEHKMASCLLRSPPRLRTSATNIESASNLKMSKQGWFDCRLLDPQLV